MFVIKPSVPRASKKARQPIVAERKGDVRTQAATTAERPIAAEQQGDDENYGVFRLTYDISNVRSTDYRGKGPNRTRQHVFW